MDWEVIDTHFKHTCSEELVRVGVVEGVDMGDEPVCVCV